jgi:hypothetical protein
LTGAVRSLSLGPMTPLATDAHRALLRVALAMIAAYAAGASLRYGLIEREDLGLICDAARTPWWCGFRLLVIRAFLHDVFGLSSLALLAIAVWRRSLPCALAAIGLGTVGMVLYSFTWSGVGVLGGLLVAGRLQLDRPEHREPQGER